MAVVHLAILRFQLRPDCLHFSGARLFEAVANRKTAETSVINRAKFIDVEVAKTDFATTIEHVA